MKTKFIVLVFLFAFSMTWAQTAQNLDVCFSDDFADITIGDNTSTNGSGTAWAGNANFPTVDKAYQAGGAVKLGTGSAIGSIQSKELDDVEGDITVNIMVKGWTTVEGDLKVSIDGQEEILSYTTLRTEGFEEVTATFTGVTAGSKLKIETTAKRAFIDSVEVLCDDSPSTNDHFKSIQSGNWTSNSTWESSEDGSTWAPATTYPKSTAISVTIQPAHNVILNTNGIQITNTDVYGSLEVRNNDFKVVGDENIELKVKEDGKFIINGSGISTGTNKGLIETGGMLVAQSLNSGTAFVENYIDADGTTSLFYFQNNSIFDWRVTGMTPASTNYPNQFRPYLPGDLVIFRINANLSNFGSSTNDNIYNALIEVNDSYDLALIGTKNKTFKGGIRGTGELTITHADTGKLIFGDASTVPVLGSNGELRLNIPSTRIEFPNGANLPSTATVILNNPTVNSTITRSGGIMTIDGTLDLTLMRITNANTGSINVNGTIRTAHSGGLYGPTSAIVEFASDKLKLNLGSTVDLNGGKQDFNTNLDYYNLIFSGSGPKTPSSAASVHTDGSVTITGSPIVNFSAHNLASTADNNTKFTMDGGRLILGKTGTQPNMRGTYNLTGGVIEFVNSQATAQTLRSSSDYFYKNIEITGTNVGNSSGNINLHTNGSFTVKSGGIFNIKQRSIKCETTDQCSVTVESGAVFRTGNNKGFNGFDNAGGIGVDDSAIHSNISAITLADDSTVEYFNSLLQQVSEFTPGYSNLKVSGKAFIDGNILVKNITSVTSTGELTIKETMQEQPSSHVLYANKGVEVESNGKLIIENNSILMQDEDAVNVGDIQFQKRFTFSTDRNQYNFIISPLKDVNMKPIYPHIPFVIYHREDKNFFYNAGNGTYIPGRGLSIKEPTKANHAGNSVIGKLTGIPANGNIEFNLTYTPNASIPTFLPGYNLVGNPYPSNLDLDLLYADNSGKIEPTFQFWDNRGNTEFEQQGSEYDGANYAKYNAVNSTGVTAGGFPIIQDEGSTYPIRIPTNLARPGTAFMIRALETPTDGRILNFKNTHRSAVNNSPEFFGKNESKNPSRYWLTLRTPTGMEYMTAVVYFDNGSNDFTLDDSEANGSSDDIYTLVGEEQIAIHGRAPFVKTDKVPLGVRLFEMGTYVISLYDKEGVFANGQNIYIRDKKLKTIYNLTQADYKFIEDAGEINDRFEIIYIPNSFTADNASEYASKIHIEKKDGNIVVTSTENKITQVEIFTLNGRSAFQKAEINNLEFKVPVNRFEKQIIVFVVETEAGEVITKKFVNK